MRKTFFSKNIVEPIYKYLHHERALNYRGYRMVVGILEKVDDKKAVIVGEKKWNLSFGSSMADISKVPIGKIVLAQAKNFDGIEFICQYLAVFEDSHLTEISEVRPQLIRSRLKNCLFFRVILIESSSIEN